MAKKPDAGTGQAVQDDAAKVATDAGAGADQAVQPVAAKVAADETALGAPGGTTLDDAVRAMVAPQVDAAATEHVYEVVHRVDHDGKAYEAGQPISLGDEHASALLAVGVIKRAA